MREKQSARKMFGISERQFRKYFEEASKKKGTTGALLLQFLERRLDNVAFKLGYAMSRRAASQLVSHGNVLVNGRKVNVPSFRVKENMVISIKPKFTEKLKSFVLETTPPGWLLRDEADLSGKIVRLPTREDAEQAIEESMIVEYYSK
jgi:small subunit ribosomal protein S4